MPCFSVSASFCILVITCSFLIRFELFKWLIKIDFKENQTYRNRNRQIMTLSGPKFHSKWAMCKPNSGFSFENRVVRVVSDVS